MMKKEVHRFDKVNISVQQCINNKIQWEEKLQGNGLDKLKCVCNMNNQNKMFSFFTNIKRQNMVFQV